MAVLQQDLAVYRDKTGKLRAHWYGDSYDGHREYISDAMRSKEVAKADRMIEQNCKNPYNQKEEENTYDNWLNKQYCESAKAELEHHLQPKQRSSRSTIEKKQKEVDKYCK